MSQPSVHRPVLLEVRPGFAFRVFAVPEVPRIAVVIPCYNAGNLVAQAVASASVDEPVELVVVDDASDDSETQGALEQLEGAGITVLSHETNSGVSAARMTGVAATSAPYVLVLDADDLMVPGRLTELAERLESDAGAAVAYGDYVEFGRHLLLRSVPEQIDSYRVAMVNEYPPVAMFRRDVLERTGGWVPVWDGLDVRSDWGLWMALAQAGERGIHLGPRRPTHLYRIHGPGLAMMGRRHHRQLYDSLRRRHAALFAELTEHRRRSPMKASRKRLYPVLYGRRSMRPWVLEPRIKRILDGIGLWTLKHQLTAVEMEDLERSVRSVLDATRADPIVGDLDVPDPFAGDTVSADRCEHGVASFEVESRDVNRRYFVERVAEMCAPGARILDFGCGSGTVVRMLRNAGFDAYGVDVRWEGADFPDLTKLPLAQAGHLRYYDAGGTLPFDERFDLIISNQVIEHVEDLGAAVAAMGSVLASGGRLYHHYPTKIALREPHLGIPFAHRIRPGKARLAYATAIRRLGFGIGGEGVPAREWAVARLGYMDRWTSYRWPAEIEEAFLGIGTVTHHEIAYCRFRGAGRPLLSKLLRAQVLKRPIERTFRRLAFDAIEVAQEPAPRR